VSAQLTLQPFHSTTYHISNHTQRNTPPRTTQATQKPRHNHRPKIRRQRRRQLPKIHQTQTQLQHNPASILFTPGCPEFAAKGVGDEEDALADARGLLGDVEFFRHARDGVAVDGGVEVHGDLDDEDDLRRVC